jgi:hypothetical protein
MSYGIVVCSKCNREIHQHTNAKSRQWYHCEDSTGMCDQADAIYPASMQQVKGNYCGKDDYFSEPYKGLSRAERRRLERKMGI